MVTKAPSEKKRDGFAGEKLISLPKTVLKKEIEDHPFLNSVYIKHIGFFPKARHHYRERKKGCEDDILIYCLDGKGWYRIGNTQYEVSKNQFIIIPATTRFLRYGASPEDPWTIYWVHFSGAKLSELNNFFSLKKFQEPQPVSFDEKKIQLWTEMYNSLEMGYNTDNLYYANMCLQYFIASFIYPEKRIELYKSAENSIINKAIDFMKNNVREKLTVEQIARHCSYSSSRFFTIFRQKTGVSPLDYFIHLRIQKSCQLLDLTDKRINEIANEVGYEDESYFSRVFKKVMDVSPRKYRNTKKG